MKQTCTGSKLSIVADIEHPATVDALNKNLQAQFKDVRSQIKTTNENMKAQFAQLRKDFKIKSATKR